MKFLCFLFMFGFSVSAFCGGPEKGFMLRGKVKDQNSSETLAGVKVSLKGTNISVYTDFEGNFSLIVPGGTTPVLDFEMLSYEPVTSVIKDQATPELEISLKERN
ncbi:MAG: carboxypeptidase-like regulatory domain-containing protein [Bacteroidia bacterium]|nr:carboxypeptidase-like regulatory domain-containing protein [Bacteroidia bacterium]